MIVYTPPWRAEGTHSLEFVTEDFVDRKGNRALVCTAHYKDKKNKDRECVAWVKWEEHLGREPSESFTRSPISR